MIKKWDVEDDETKNKCIQQVINRISDIEDPETVGAITAQEVVDIVKEHVAPAIYNKAIEDARKTFQEKFDDLQVDLDILTQK